LYLHPYFFTGEDMTKDEALQMCLEYIETDAHERKYVRHAIKAALEANEFNPDWDTQAVLVEEIQRMAKRIEELEAKDEPWEKFCDSHCVWTDHHPDCKLAQRTWVGLTDEHKEGLICMTDPNPEPHHLRELIDVVEFQLKEKNT
jgi:hypothetical protein